MRELKRIFLVVLLVLTGMATLIVAGVLLANPGYRGEDMAAESAVSCGFLLMISFAAFTAFDRPILRGFAFSGCILSGMLIVVFPLFVWWEQTPAGPHVDWELRKIVSQSLVTSFASAALLCLVPFVLAPRGKILMRVVQVVSAVCIGSTYVLILMGLWMRNPGRQIGRILLCGMIFSGAGILATFILSRFFGIRKTDVLSTVGQLMHIQCPRCSREQEIAIGDSACAFCKLKIKIEVEEPRCVKCGYNLHQLTRPICPECGTPVNPQRGRSEPVGANEPGQN